MLLILITLSLNPSPSSATLSADVPADISSSANSSCIRKIIGKGNEHNTKDSRKRVILVVGNIINVQSDITSFVNTRNSLTDSSQE
jgi:hypothetical protein